MAYRYHLTSRWPGLENNLIDVPSKKAVAKVENTVPQQLSLANLCLYCKHALYDWARILREVDGSLSLTQSYQHHSDVSGLGVAVEVSRCRICWIFLRTARDLSGEDSSPMLDHENGLTISSCGPSYGRNMEWTLQCESDGANPYNRSPHLLCESCSFMPNPFHQIFRSPAIIARRSFQGF